MKMEHTKKLKKAAEKIQLRSSFVSFFFNDGGFERRQRDTVTKVWRFMIQSTFCALVMEKPSDPLKVIP